MSANTGRTLVIPGTGIDSPDGVNVSVTAQYVGLIEGAEQAVNKGVPGGYAEILEDGTIPGILVHRTGTAAQLNALVLSLGELAFATDTEEWRQGDGVTAGGSALVAAAPSSTSTITLLAEGTPTQNGTALVNAYAAAKLLTPNGAALSATNRATIVLHPGVYSHSGLTLDSAFVDIVGLGGSSCVTIINTSTLDINNAGCGLRGIRFCSRNDGVAADCGISFRTTPNPVHTWEDLFFDTNGGTSNNAMTTFSGGTVGGTYRRCRTLGQRFIGNVSSLASTTSVLFEDCEAGALSLMGSGSIIGTQHGNMNGIMRRCVITASAWNCKLGAVALVEDCRFVGCRIPRLTTGATIRRCTILPGSSTCLGNSSDDTAAINATFNVLKTFAGASPYATNITNAVGTSNTVAMNVHSDTAA